MNHLSYRTPRVYANKVLPIALSLALQCSHALADTPLIYQYDSNTNSCRDAQGKEGVNEGYIGECGYLEHSVFYGRDFSNTRLRGSVWPSTALRFAKLQNADLQGIWFGRGRMEHADLSGADLTTANLDFSELNNANLSRIKATGASFAGCDLSLANLDQADLSAANLEGALLFRANFGSASLAFANLQRSDLRGANLIGADLSGCDLRGSKYDGETKLPFDEKEATKLGMFRADSN